MGEQNKMAMRFYLAHPFDSRKDMREWELAIEVALGIDIINPFYDVKRTDVPAIDKGREERYKQNRKQVIELVTRDVRQILKSDGVIAIIGDHLSYGTIQEMVYARMNQKPVLAVITNGQENHPWLRYHSNKIFTSLSGLEEYLKEKLLKE